MCVRYGHSSLTVDETLPLETCDTVHANGAWGYTADHTPKDIDTLVRLLVPPRPRTCNTEGGLRLGSVLRLGSCLATRILSCDSDPVLRLGSCLVPCGADAWRGEGGSGVLRGETGTGPCLGVAGHPEAAWRAAPRRPACTNGVPPTVDMRARAAIVWLMCAPDQPV